MSPPPSAARHSSALPANEASAAPVKVAVRVAWLMATACQARPRRPGSSNGKPGCDAAISLRPRRPACSWRGAHGTDGRMSADLEVKPGARSLVQPGGEAATGVGPGKRTLTEQLDARPARPTTYTVRPGDSLAQIAARLGVTVDALRAANADKLKRFPTRTGAIEGFNAGEILTIPRAEAPARSVAAPAVVHDDLFAAVGGT